MKPMLVIGIDAAFANMGLASATIGMRAGRPAILSCDNLHLITTEVEAKKQVRVSSDELRRAVLLHDGLKEWIARCNPVLAFAEIPSGSQSASAARCLGIAVGVLASCSVPIVEVSPMDVKRYFSTKGTVSKDQIIAWAADRWPDAPWLRTKRKGAMELTKSNEHLADAMATIAAGLNTAEFKQLLAFQNHAISSTDHDRPTSSRRPRRRISVGLV
jgi:Holliday junction resolvasome RuvABC endonuclease subunit